MAGGLFSCETDLPLDLSESEPRVVVEGWITDLPGPYLIKVSYTTAYLGESPDVPISGATVIARDDIGGVDTLEEIRAGYYQTGHLQGQQLHTYTLDVTVDGTTYSAQNYLPRLGPILGSDFEYCDTCVFGEGYYVGIVAQEPAGIGDFYSFRIYRNDSLFNEPFDNFVTDDRLVDGQLSPFLYPYPHEEGDTIVAEVRGISLLSYDYFLTVFQQVSGGGSPFGSPPDNLLTNFNNNGLGFFGTASVARDTLIIMP